MYYIILTYKSVNEKVFYQETTLQRCNTEIIKIVYVIFLWLFLARRHHLKVSTLPSISISFTLLCQRREIIKSPTITSFRVYSTYNASKQLPRSTIIYEKPNLKTAQIFFGHLFFNNLFSMII